MKIKKGFEFFLIALILITFVSCGGSGSGIGSNGGGVGGSGFSKQVVSKGTITGFGSVIVNGVEFETTGATITTNGTSATQGDLGLGMVVTVNGTVNSDGTTGSANSVEFEDNLEGPITSTDPAGQTIVVLGQTVSWDSSTICENSSSASIDCATLTVNNLVEVSGYPTTSGTILATRIEIKDQIFDPADEVELKGTISGLTATTFLIGTQAVGYSSTTVFENVSISTLADGMFVEVKGNLAAGVLEATKIKLEGEGLDVGEDQDVRIEGLVTVFTSCNGSDCTFEVNGQHVQTSSATEFKNGLPSDIAVGVRLEVEGTIDANGVLVASAISFHNERVEIEAEVQSVDTVNNSVALLGITVTATLLTEFDDNTSAKLEPFSLGDINSGDFLRIRGHLDNGSVIADRIERRDPEADVLLQGPVDSVSNPNLIILGVMVQTSSQTQFQADFFDQVQSGTMVKAKGVFDSSVIVADEVGIVD